MKSILEYLQTLSKKQNYTAQLQDTKVRTHNKDMGKKCQKDILKNLTKQQE